MRNLLVLLLALALLPMAQGQVSSPSPRTVPRPPAPGPPAGMPAAAPDLSPTLEQLNQVVEQSRVDLARLRVEKWKTGSGMKRQAEANVESVQRNLTAALPAIVQQVRANPGSVAATFKLYRNLNALYDVMMSLTESAGAFGPKDDYQALANDTAGLDNLRRSLADKVEAMAAARDAELAQLQTRVRQAAAAAAPPKKIVIDENEAEKKSAKRTTTKKKPAAASPQQTAPKPQ